MSLITRKIQIYVSEEDKELKKQFVHTIYDWRNQIRRAANIVVSHKFTQENIKDFVYLKDEIKEKFYVKDILKEGKGMSEQNTTYRVLADLLKGKIPSDIYSCLNQAVAKTFKETKSEIFKGETALRSYKNNIPVPFSSDSIRNLHWEEKDKRFYFTLFGIPFATALGADRSNNKVIIERVLSGEYKLCQSSIQIDDRKKKMFLLLCVDIPKKEVKLNPDKKLYAFLGVFNPIVCTTEITDDLDAKNPYKVWEIGTEEEFNHRRRQIQEAVKRCQINSRYTEGGKGRKKKTKAIDRFHEKEKNYIDTKLHTYSRMLVDLAIKNECSEIVLMKQKEREEMAKEDNQNGKPFVLRNWSYYGLKDKISYKAKMVGIGITVE